MIGPVRLRRMVRAYPWLSDVVPATAVAVAGVVPLVFGLEPDGYQPSGSAAVAAAVAFVLLLVRRRAPLPVLALALLGAAAFTVVASNLPAALVATSMVAVYTVGRTADRRTAIIAATSAAVTLFSVNALARGSAADPENFAVLAWAGMVAAIGGTIRTWRDYLVAVEERATRAEAGKELEARRRVAEERLRIARELHDVIAHHIALMNVQAGIASHLLRTEPDQADVALGQMREAGRTVLEELSSVLYVLRQPGDDGAPTEPVPDLSRLSALLDALTAAGLRVHHRRTGIPRPLPIANRGGRLPHHPGGADQRAEARRRRYPSADRLPAGRVAHPDPQPGAYPVVPGRGHRARADRHARTRPRGRRHPGRRSRTGRKLRPGRAAPGTRTRQDTI